MDCGRNILAAFLQIISTQNSLRGLCTGHPMLIYMAEILAVVLEGKISEVLVLKMVLDLRSFYDDVYFLLTLTLKLQRLGVDEG